MTCKELTCKEFIDFLADYLDGELPVERKVIFDRHLAICPDCVAYMDSYNSTLGLLKVAGSQADSGLPQEGPEEVPEKLPEDVPQSLIDAILATQPNPRSE